MNIKLKKLFVLCLFIILSFSLTGCYSKGVKTIKPFSTENELKEFTFEVNDEDNHEILNDVNYSRYALKASKQYYLSFHISVDLDFSLLDQLLSVVVISKDNIKEFDTEEADTVNISKEDNEMLLAYTIDDLTFATDITIRFKVNENTDDFLDSFIIYAFSDKNVYLNNTDFFSYSISDYFGATMGYETEVPYSYVYFGTYPQTHVSNSQIIKQLNRLIETNSKGYYELDGKEYAKVSQSENNLGKLYSDSSKVTSDLAYFVVEPILWRVITNADGKYTLLSEYTLDLYNYGEKQYKTTFTKTEKTIIGDAVFKKIEKSLISDLKSGFLSNERRKSPVSDYALAQGVLYDEALKTSEWTGYELYVDYYGVTTEDKNSTEIENIGFRPCLEISNGGYIFRSNNNYVILSILLFFAILVFVVIMSCHLDTYKSLIYVAIAIAIHLSLMFFTTLNGWALLVIIPLAIAIFIDYKKEW